MINLLIVILLALYAPAEQKAVECAKFDTLATALGAIILAPPADRPDDNTDLKFWDMPDDVYQIHWRKTEPDGTEFWYFESPSTAERFVFYFYSMELGADGHPHRFCGPYQMQPGA
jgi:hypothetical protein